MRVNHLSAETRNIRKRFRPGLGISLYGEFGRDLYAGWAEPASHNDGSEKDHVRNHRHYRQGGRRDRP